MDIKGLQVTKEAIITVDAPVDRVFPLYCPEREKEWIDGWDYRMVHSESGYVESGCVFITTHHSAEPTVWYVTGHDPANHTVEMVRVSPGEMVVRLRIVSTAIDAERSRSHVTYEYTALNETVNTWLRESVDEAFQKMMTGWEKALNHYMTTGKKLIQEQG